MKKLTKKFKDRIKEIPGETGFWKTGTEESFFNAAAVLLGLGMTEDRVIEFLTDIFLSVSDEYGN